VSPISPAKTIDKGRLAIAQPMLVALFVLIKTARVYESNNDSYRSQASRFFALLTKYLEDRNSCSIKVVSRRLFVDDQFVSVDNDDRIGVGMVLERWAELGIGGLVFGDTTEPGDIDTLINLLWSFSTSGGNPYKEFSAELAELGDDSIYLMPKSATDREEQIS
jgi:hypothetical protein